MWYDYYSDKTVVCEVCEKIKNSILSDYKKSDNEKSSSHSSSK